MCLLSLTAGRSWKSGIVSWKSSLPVTHRNKSKLPKTVSLKIYLKVLQWITGLKISSWFISEPPSLNHTFRQFASLYAVIHTWFCMFFRDVSSQSLCPVSCLKACLFVAVVWLCGFCIETGSCSVAQTKESWTQYVAGTNLTTWGESSSAEELPGSGGSVALPAGCFLNW